MEQQAGYSTSGPAIRGSRDGRGAGDHDVPFSFGHRPTAAWTAPFSGLQFARLLVLRGRVQDGDFLDDRQKA